MLLQDGFLVFVVALKIKEKHCGYRLLSRFSLFCHKYSNCVNAGIINDFIPLLSYTTYYITNDGN